jgi:hypothetical protein
MVMKQKPQQCNINVSMMPLILLTTTTINRRRHGMQCVAKKTKSLNFNIRKKNKTCYHAKEKNSPFKEQWNATCNKKNKKPKA